MPTSDYFRNRLTIAKDILPQRDIKTNGKEVVIIDIAKRILSPHERPFTGLNFEGWFTNTTVRTLYDEDAPAARCICAADPVWHKQWAHVVIGPAPVFKKDKGKGKKSKNKNVTDTTMSSTAS